MVQSYNRLKKRHIKAVFVNIIVDLIFILLYFKNFLSIAHISLMVFFTIIFIGNIILDLRGKKTMTNLIKILRRK